MWVRVSGFIVSPPIEKCWHKNPPKRKQPPGTVRCHSGNDITPSQHISSAARRVKHSPARSLSQQDTSISQLTDISHKRRLFLTCGGHTRQVSSGSSFNPNNGGYYCKITPHHPAEAKHLRLKQAESRTTIRWAKSSEWEEWDRSHTELQQNLTNTMIKKHVKVKCKVSGSLDLFWLIFHTVTRLNEPNADEKHLKVSAEGKLLLYLHARL